MKIPVTCPRCKSNFRALDGHTTYALCSGCMSIEFPNWRKTKKGETMMPFTLDDLMKLQTHEVVNLINCYREALMEIASGDLHEDGNTARAALNYKP